VKHSSLTSVLKFHTKKWSPGHYIKLEGFHVDFLVSLYRACKFPTVLICPDRLFDDVFHFCSTILNKKSVVCVPPKRSVQRGPKGFISKHQQYHERAASVFGSGAVGVNFIICAESMLLEKLVSTDSDGLDLINGVGFDQCRAFLQNENYCQVDVVLSPGEFALRGGIIDVFPRGSALPSRISFLEDSLSIHSFNVDSQITTAAVNSLFLANSAKTPLLSLANALRSDFVFLFYNISLQLDFHETFNINYIFNTLEYRDFININNNNVNCIVDGNLSTVGALFSSCDAIIPPWFMGEGPPIKLNISSQEKAPLLRLSSIQKGDFIVHRSHGVGICLGLGGSEKNASQEFLSIKYNDGGIIRVDSGHLNLVDYYASSDVEGVVVDSLNKKSVWKRKYASAKKNAEKTVDKLVKLYVARDSIDKKPLCDGGSIEDDFIFSFPYKETIDQSCAWKDISNDLDSNSPMDRLLCGDVGFGKTELAMRAAFRCVVGKKRAVVLAPTTILVNQLFKSFKIRMKNFAVNISMVSRLCSKQQIRLALENIKKGYNDILIGTHAILNNDIYLKNIGLLIIDEEHRFGVRHKEKIKAYKDNIDVLSMSATPIPRSMNLAMSGIYSISLLQSPPLMRLPIITRVEYYDDALIKKYIMYEINSGGQVFFIHNNVKNIGFVADRLSELLPDFIIEVLHGQESASSIDKKMSLFSEKKIHVLVCTSIIEAGIDVPTANCIIINNAHMFGLSQLYQMRGRVGRSNKQAYAYLIVPKNVKLSNKAYSRIKAIENNSQLGAGYNVARSDMNIRGTGHLFGYKQSGSGGAVGYELYMKLIQRSLHNMGGVDPSFSILPEDVVVKIYTDRHIPNIYISHEGVRLSFYRSISSASNKNELDDICANMENRFGPLPFAVKNLIKEALLRQGAARFGVSSIIKKGCGVVLEIHNNNGNLVFPSFIEYVTVFFTKRNITFHVLPKAETVIFLCIHLLNYKDKYSILSEFLNKFKITKQ
tara:strand:- start:606 stop:3587 length:2982 start_codon:yes stop_codon:yes gene_type:complete